MSPETQPVKISIDSLSMSYRTDTAEILALDNISLDVRENEFLCILGPSGCGKTTLLNIIAGFLQPTSGHVRIGDRPIIGPGPDRVVVFQEDAVFPWMTVEQNIGFSARVNGKSEGEIWKIADRYIKLVHLQEFRSAWPKELSGGMKKRVDLARGYAADPEVLLLDEPFGALDIMTKENLQEELHKIWLESPRTTILITHDIEEALFLGDRVFVMSRRPGQIASIHEPGFPKPRDMSFKTEPDFVEFRARIRGELIR